VEKCKVDFGRLQEAGCWAAWSKVLSALDKEKRKNGKKNKKEKRIRVTGNE
jgi:hypothetical protein